ncbi:MAG: hypothetical protein CM15mP74_28410 [Halieaceae bacterium]|nr:MAG: hypothetical protein CM15mP74_28410 [Halieaceae bacterium]
MSNPITDLIAAKSWCVADGATGSNFLAAVLKRATHPICGVWRNPRKCCGCTVRFLRRAPILF